MLPSLWNRSDPFGVEYPLGVIDMAKIFIEGLQDPVAVSDAPDFGEACVQISEHNPGDLIIFPTADADIAIVKGKLIMFVQETHRKQGGRKQYVIPAVIDENVPQKKKKRGRRPKDVRPTSVQEKDSE